MTPLAQADAALAAGKPQEARSHAARGYATIRNERARAEAAPALRAIKEEVQRIESALSVLPPTCTLALGHRATLQILKRRKAGIVAQLVAQLVEGI